MSEAETGPGADLLESPGPHWQPCAHVHSQKRCSKVDVFVFLFCVIVLANYNKKSKKQINLNQLKKCCIY